MDEYIFKTKTSNFIVLKTKTKAIAVIWTCQAAGSEIFSGFLKFLEDSTPNFAIGI
jgi:hypothetical protein